MNSLSKRSTGKLQHSDKRGNGGNGGINYSPSISPAPAANRTGNAAHEHEPCQERRAGPGITFLETVGMRAVLPSSVTSSQSLFFIRIKADVSFSRSHGRCCSVWDSSDHSASGITAGIAADAPGYR